MLHGTVILPGYFLDWFWNGSGLVVETRIFNERRVEMILSRLIHLYSDF